jgi:hypothetical protein
VGTVDPYQEAQNEYKAKRQGDISGWINPVGACFYSLGLRSISTFVCMGEMGRTNIFLGILVWCNTYDFGSLHIFS